MNNLEYLNQISQSNRPAKKPSLLTNPIIKVALIGIVLLIIVLIIGVAVRSSAGPATNDLAVQVKLRSDNLSTVINDYNSKLKSSNLRAINATLKTAIGGATSQLDSYFSSQEIDSTPTEETSLAEDSQKAALVATLNNAKLNGILDRIYTNQLQLQVSLLISLISQTIARTDDAELINILGNYSANLENISLSIQNYSNPSV